MFYETGVYQRVRLGRHVLCDRCVSESEDWKASSEVVT
jgi:hypothetical protein